MVCGPVGRDCDGVMHASVLSPAEGRIQDSFGKIDMGHLIQDFFEAKSSQRNTNLRWD